MDWRRYRRVACGVVVGGHALLLVISGVARAQEMPAAPPASAAPAPAPAPAQAAITPREAELEARVRQLEAMVNTLSSQVARMSAASTAPAPAGADVTTDGTAAPDVGSPATAVAPSAKGGVGAPGQSMPPTPPPSDRFNSPATLESRKANSRFGPGFELRTDDDEFILQFHNLTQFDYRGYTQSAQQTVHDTFAFPRQWFMFNGRLTKPFGYFVSFANGFDTFSILDVFLDVEYDPRIRLRIGRYKTPFTYEFFVEPIQGLVIPERSLFFNNFALNRDLGIMAYGRFNQVNWDYAVAITNGTRNGFLDQDNAKDVVAFTNWRPFGNQQGSLLENFNIGGSVFGGPQRHVPVVQTFRTVVPTTGNAIIGVPFLGLSSNVIDSGPRALWDMHAAWYYKQLAVIGEWGSGFEDYAHSATPNSRIRVPIQSFYAQASYLLTGETRSSVGIVKPNRPFNPVAGQFGTGAIEPFFRYEFLDIGRDVFSSGLADQNLWTHRLYATHVGANWHLTQYIKMYFDWNYDGFSSPVVIAPGRREVSSNLFLVRFQVYF